MWEYKATVLKVLDGDTIEVHIDLGFKIYIIQTVRLSGINTFELKSKDDNERLLAIKAKHRLSQLLQNPLVTLKTFKTSEQEKFGRFLALVVNSQNQIVNEVLISEGLATKYR